MKNERYTRMNLKALFLDQRIYSVFLILFAAFDFFAKLGLNGMANYDDCFYAEKAKEILKTGDWLVMHYDFRPNYENPPFFMWLDALSFKVFGISVWAAKAPAALMGVLTVWLTYHIGARSFNPRVGFYAGFFLITTVAFSKYSRHAMIDTTVAFLATLAMLSLLWAVQKDRRFFLLWGLCLGLAFLSKSILGLFPLAVTSVFMMLTSRFRLFWDKWFILGSAICGFFVVSWVVIQYSSSPQDFIDVHLKFLLYGKTLGNLAGPHYWTQYLSVAKDLCTSDWPWLPLTVYGLYLLFKNGFRNREVETLLILWCLMLPIALSFCSSTVWYLMQVFPAFVLVAGYAMDRIVSTDLARIRSIQGLMVVGLGIVIYANVLPFPVDLNREKDVRVLAPYVKYYSEKGAEVISLHEGFDSLNNSLLFYSDHAAEPIFDDVAGFAKTFGSSNLVLALVHPRDMEQVQKAVRAYYPVKNTDGDWLLIANQRLDTSEVKTWGDLWEK